MSSRIDLRAGLSRAFLRLILVGLSSAAAGCALLPPATTPGEAINLAVDGEIAYVAMGGAGLGVFDPATRQLQTLPPPAGSESVDDVSLGDGLLFALDARAPGHLTVLSLADPRHPTVVAAPVVVPVGPFSGVSAAHGRVIVSGGTSEMTIRTYDSKGALGAEVTSLDLGRGQPDVLLAPDGEHAFVSTHFSLLRATFGLTVVRLGAALHDAAPVAQVPLDDAGFTTGAARPANFALTSALRGTNLFVASGGGLSSFDVGDPAHPRLLARLPLPVRAVHIDVHGTTAAIVGSSPAPTLVLVDVGRPDAPIIERTVPLPEQSRPTSVALTGTRALVAAGAAGVVVVER